MLEGESGTHNMIFIGFDPGLQGGIAMIGDGDPFVCRMPTIGEKDYDIQEIKNILLRINERSFATIEQQIALPGQGLSSTLQTGKGFGILLGLLAGLDIPHQVVPAKKWQAKLFTGVKATLDTKDKSIIIAKRLCPRVDFRKSERATKAHDGLTDALCIAEYGRLSHSKEVQGTSEPFREHTPMPGNEAVCLMCGKLIDHDDEGCIKKTP